MSKLPVARTLSFKAKQWLIGSKFETKLNELDCLVIIVPVQGSSYLELNMLNFRLSIRSIRDWPIDGDWYDPWKTGAPYIWPIAAARDCFLTEYVSQSFWNLISSSIPQILPFWLICCFILFSRMGLCILELRVTYYRYIATSKRSLFYPNSDSLGLNQSILQTQ